MANVVLVAVVDSGGNLPVINFEINMKGFEKKELPRNYPLPEYSFSLLLIKALLIAQVIVEFSTRSNLHHKHHLLLVLKHCRVNSLFDTFVS